MKKVAIIFVLLLAVLLFGCTSSTNDMKQINQLQEKYGLTNSFVPSDQIMLSYSNEIIELDLKSTLADVELYSAQSFYQLLLLTQQINGLDVSKENCKSVPVIKAYQTSIMCEITSQKAIEKINLLSSSEKEMLRYGQKEFVQDYLNTCQEIKNDLKSFCSTLN